MCGVSVIVDKKSKITEGPILAMNKFLSHRGPDHSGYKLFKAGQLQIFFGNTRLRISDPDPAADQPFVDVKLNTALTFNGEIYNHQELRQELKKDGQSFNTRSDTEVVSHLLSRKQENALTHLSGMFAFVFLDLQNNTLIIARDRHGLKPLYYYEDNDFLIISSETRPILASGLVSAKLNESEIPHYLVYRYTSPGSTFYKNIKEVLPGRFAKIRIDIDQENKNLLRESDFCPHLETHYGLEAKIDLENDKQIIFNVQNLLTEAVLKTFPANQNSGIFLSGGVDSTLITAILRKETDLKINTFSVTGNENDKNFGTKDYFYSRQASRLFETNHTELEINASLLDSFDEYFSTVDQPVADNGGWLTYLLSKKARHSVNVILSGAGADEYFAGYNRIKAFKLYLDLLPVGTPLLNKLAKFPEGMNIPLRESFRLTNRFLSSVNQIPGNTWLNFIALSFFGNHFKQKFQILFNSKKDYLQQALDHDKSHYLPFDVLNITDRASMACGIEARIPFLYDPLVKIINKIPADILLKNGRKWILKEVLRNYKGAPFASRKKEGFGMPLGNWLRDHTRHTLLKLFKSSTPISRYLSEQTLNSIYQLHFSRKQDLSAEIYSLILLDAWLQREFPG